MSNQCETLELFCFAQTWNRPDSIGKIGSIRYNNLLYCYSFCKNILKYLSRMARFSLRTAERSMFLPVRTVSDASGLCKCSIKVPFVVYGLMVNNDNNNNNNDIFNSLSTTKEILFANAPSACTHVDTCIYFYLFFFFFFGHAHDCLFIPPYLYKQLKTPGMLCHTEYSEY